MAAEDFGITEYLSQMTMIECTLKHLFSDFIVHETVEFDAAHDHRDIDKRTVRLRCVDAPTSTIPESTISKPIEIDDEILEKLEQLASDRNGDERAYSSRTSEQVSMSGDSRLDSTTVCCETHVDNKTRQHATGDRCDATGKG